jgi:hypothetical protein
MGASRAAATQLLGLVHDARRHGTVEALERRLNVSGLAGQSAADIFIELVEFMCPPHGGIDEALARQAMLEAIGDLAEGGLGDVETLTPELLNEFFLDFVSRSIEGRVMADIGGRGITLPDDVRAVALLQEQVHDFVAGCTRGALRDRLGNVQRLSDGELGRVVTDIYESAFELLAAASEDEG